MNLHFLLVDSLKLFSSGKVEVKLKKTGIAWPSDRKIKFNNPPGALNDTGGVFPHMFSVVSHLRCRLWWFVGDHYIVVE